MRNVYKNAPIEEALCEFRFSGAEWDLTIPGRLRDRLPDYPGKPRQQNVFQATLGMSGPGSQPAFEMAQSYGKVQLPSADGKRLVAVGENVLSVHILRPYSRWELFRPKIEEALTAYLGLLAAKPTISRVGVRYINKVVIPKSDVRPSEYFRCSNGTIEGIDARPTSFVSRNEYSYDADTKLISTYATIDAAAGSSGYLLDLDVIWEGREARDPAGIMTVVDGLRDRERSAFEAAILDPLRDLFNAD